MSASATPDAIDAAHARAAAAFEAGAFAAAAAALEEALALGAAAGLPADPLAEVNLAGARLWLGEVEAARAAYLRAVAAARAAADPRAEAAAVAGLGHVAHAEGRHAAAARHHADAAARLAAAGDLAGAVGCHIDAARTFREAADADAADAEFDNALVIMRAAAPPDQTAALLLEQAELRLEWHRDAAAVAALDAALALAPAIDHLGGPAPRPRSAGDPQPFDAAGRPAVIAPALVAELRAQRGVAHARTGALAAAEDDLLAARAAFEALGDPRRQAHQAASLAALYRAKELIGPALASHREVMALEAAHGFTLDEAARLLEVPAGPAPGSPAEAPARVADNHPTAPTRAAAGHGRRPFLIFSPPCDGVYGPIFPRGATALASFLRHHGVPAEVVPLSAWLGHDLTPLAAFHRMREVVADAIAHFDPCAVGISVTFSYLYPLGVAIARAAREATAVPIVIGGPHVTYYDKECLQEVPEIDVVARGEGEWTALDLLTALQTGRDLSTVEGITWRRPDGAIQKNPKRALGDVRALPPVDFTLLPRDFAGRMEVTGVTSRGCEYRCRFCHEFRYWGGVVREYPPERVVGELERLATQHGNVMRAIDDSMLNMHKGYFFDLMGLLGRSPHVPPGFALLTRINTVSADGLRAMRDAGVQRLAVGLESGSPKVLEAMNKDIGLPETLAGMALVQGAGVELYTFYIVGHPGDDPDESERTLAFAQRSFDDGFVHGLDVAMFIPYPGTPFYISPDRHGVRILTHDWAKWRRTGRPVCELTTYPANAIYLNYLRMLDLDAAGRARAAAPAAAHPGVG